MPGPSLQRAATVWMELIQPRIRNRISRNTQSVHELCFNKPFCVHYYSTELAYKSVSCFYSMRAFSPVEARDLHTELVQINSADLVQNFRLQLITVRGHDSGCRPRPPLWTVVTMMMSFICSVKALSQGLAAVYQTHEPADACEE
jgi:hypothetical protein